MESFGKRVRRHLEKGDIGLSTLQRGFIQFLQLMEAQRRTNQPVKEVFFESYITDDCGVALTHCFFPLSKKESKGKAAAEFVSFPTDARIRVYVDPIPYNYLSDYPQRHKEVIAMFVGPTSSTNFDDLNLVHFPHLPNNGFWHKDALEENRVPFGDTNPPGERRGAFSLNDDGELKLLTDREKWKIISNNFEGYEVVSGTSFYITSEDSADTPEIVKDDILSDNTISIVSYLIQYNDLEDRTRIAYMVTNTMVARKDVKKMIDGFITNCGGKKYMAVELEYYGAGCIVKLQQANGEDIKNIGNFHQQSDDHYIVEYGK